MKKTVFEIIAMAFLFSVLLGVALAFGLVLT
jgi:hypothetical protein